MLHMPISLQQNRRSWYVVEYTHVVLQRTIKAAVFVIHGVLNPERQNVLPQLTVNPCPQLFADLGVGDHGFVWLRHSTPYVAPQP